MDGINNSVSAVLCCDVVCSVLCSVLLLIVRDRQVATRLGLSRLPEVHGGHLC